MRSARYLLPVLFLAIAAGCSSEEDEDRSGTPVIPSPWLNDINGASDPKSPVQLPIELNGWGFGTAPGAVRFLQGAVSVDVVPAAAAWSDPSILVVVPTGDGATDFTVPGTVTVSVVASSGTTNGIDLDLVAVPTFAPNSLAWAATTALPAAKNGLKAQTVTHTDTHAYLYACGGQTASGNSDEVLFTDLTVSGATFGVGASWTATTALPAPRAFHASACAEAPTATIAPGTAYLYVLGGQEAATDAPGGTATVWFAALNLADGTVGSWGSTTALPGPRIGHTALVSNGYLYVTGGLDSSGNPQSTIWTAQILAGGGLSAFRTASNSLPTPLSFHATFAFAGHFYTLGGLTASSSDPNDLAITGLTDDVSFATVSRGSLGTFSATVKLGKAVSKHLVYDAFGQVVRAEGVYNGWGSGSSEVSGTTVNLDGTLSSFGGLTGSNTPGANVCNAAGALSPIVPTGGGPRFFIIGGMDSLGVRQAAVYVNTAP